MIFGYTEECLVAKAGYAGHRIKHLGGEALLCCLLESAYLENVKLGVLYIDS